MVKLSRKKEDKKEVVDSVWHLPINLPKPASLKNSLAGGLLFTRKSSTGEITSSFN